MIGSTTSSFDSSQLAALAVGSATLIYFLGKKKKPLEDGASYPPHYSSWIPFLGSAIELTKGYTRDFVINTSKKLDGSPVFTATIAGTKCVFIADPKYTPFIFKSIPQIDDYSLQKSFLKNVCGLSEAEAENVKDNTIPNHIFKANMMHEEPLSSSMAQVQSILFDEIKQLIHGKQEQTEDTDGWIRNPLFDFIRKVVFKASMGTLISKCLVNDESLNDYCTFEDAIPLLMTGVPKLMVKKGIDARERLIQKMLDPDFNEGASDIMKERKAKLSFGEKLSARFNQAITFAAVGNSMPAVFWTFCHLLADSKAYQACLTQVEAVAAKREADRTTFTIEELDEMSLLHSAFYEALRMYQNAPTARDVIDDFILNPKEENGKKFMIEKGTRLMSYPGVTHYDETIFEEPNTFKYDRFADPGAKAKNGSLLISNVRPWGGGAHLCLGRKFITLEVKAVMAIMMMTLDLRLAPGEEVPDIDFNKQSVSVYHPSRDPFMEVRLRKDLVA